MNQQIEDKIVLRVLSRFSERSQVGINKYNTTWHIAEKYYNETFKSE